MTDVSRPRIIVLSGYGINCEEETRYAFEIAGGEAEIVHINDLISGKKILMNYDIMAIPGGFSFGDDTGSGNAFANRLRNHLWNMITGFIKEDKLVIGICNGFQILVNLGLLPAIDKEYGKRQVALLHNDSAKYMDRWVDLKFEGNSPWVKGIETISLPIAHGEGKFYSDDTTLDIIEDSGLVSARYFKGEMCDYQDLISNPNGSMNEIASITDVTGRIIGMMPHPERAIHVTQLPNFQSLKESALRSGKILDEEGPGMKIFKNGVGYFDKKK